MTGPNSIQQFDRVFRAVSDEAWQAMELQDWLDRADGITPFEEDIEYDRNA